jgi:uncharacterized protein (TIGR02246 family)
VPPDLNAAARVGQREKRVDVSVPAAPDPVTLVLDRLAISDLVHAYAQGVDRRDAEAVAQLFTDDGIFVAYATPGAAEPTSRSHGHAEITKAIGTARYYRQTTHTIGNHLATVSGDRATGETRCVAYHVLGDEGTETLMVWHIRYLDTYARVPEGWRIEERVLRVDLVSDQPLRTG